MWDDRDVPLLPAILCSKLGWLTVGAAGLAAASRTAGWDGLANVCEIVSTHGAISHALGHEASDALRRTVERVAAAMATDFASRRSGRGALPSDEEDERTFAKLDGLLSARVLPPLCDIVAADIAFDEIRLRLQASVARADDEFAPDQRGGQTLARLLTAAFAALEADTGFAHQLQLPVAAETLRRLRALTQGQAEIRAEVAGLPDAIVSRLVAELDARGETRRAAEAGLERQTIFRLARQLRRDQWQSRFL